MSFNIRSRLEEFTLYTESTTCPICGKVIKWESLEMGSLSVKVEYHQNKDKECIREGKIKALLSDIKQP